MVVTLYLKMVIKYLNFYEQLSIMEKRNPHLH